MKTFTLKQCILLMFLALCGNSSHAQNGLGPPTTFGDLYARSDFIGWIRIIDQRYEMIAYRREDGKRDYDIATINTFKVIDKIKKTSGTPNEFISIGGEYPAGHPLYGQALYQTSEVYFEAGDEIFVHLGKNDLLFDRLQVLGVIPGGRSTSVFLIDDSGPKLQIVPYNTNETFQSGTHLEARAAITLKENVVSPHRAPIDYAQLKSMYKSLSAGSGEGSK